MTNQEMPLCPICGKNEFVFVGSYDSDEYYCSCGLCKIFTSNYDAKGEAIESFAAIPRQPQLSELEQNVLSEFERMNVLGYEINQRETGWSGEHDETDEYTLALTKKQPVWKVGTGFVVHGVPWAITRIYNCEPCWSSKCRMINLFTMEVSDDFVYPPDSDREFQTKEQLLKLAAKRAKEVDND